MRTITSSVPNTDSPGNQSYSPSVPISVYKDLAAELQAAQVMIDALANKNQELIQENQQLRQEIYKAVQSVVPLQKLVDSHAAPNYNRNPHSSPNLRTQATHQVKSEIKAEVKPVQKKRPTQSPRTILSPPTADMPQPPIYIEEQLVEYYTEPQSESKEMSAWSLVISILLIILTAFGTGYLIIRPILQHQNR
jgi:uncharacterized membrane protein